MCGQLLGGATHAFAVSGRVRVAARREGEAVVGGPVRVYPECIMVRVGARVGPGGLPSCGEWIRAGGQLLVSAAHEFASLGCVRVAA